MTTQKTKVPHVIEAIQEVRQALVEVGIAKAQKNRDQGWSFRGIDDVLRAVTPVAVNAGLLITPQIRSVETKPKIFRGRNGNESHWDHVTLLVDFEFESVKDGSMKTVAGIGEAMSSSDKGTGAAQSYALKNCLINVFGIPVPDADPDLVTPPDTVRAEVTAKPKQNGNELYALREAIASSTNDDEVRKLAMDFMRDDSIGDKDRKQLAIAFCDQRASLCVGEAGNQSVAKMVSAFQERGWITRQKATAVQKLVMDRVAAT